MLHGLDRLAIAGVVRSSTYGTPRRPSGERPCVGRHWLWAAIPAERTGGRRDKMHQRFSKR